MCLKLTIKTPVQRLDTCITVLLFSIVYLFGWLKDTTKKQEQTDTKLTKQKTELLNCLA